MIVLVLVLAALGLALAAALLVLALQRRSAAVRAADPTARERPAAPSGTTSLDRLAVGADVAYDDREWRVLGAERLAARDGSPAWTAWHLEIDGQPGWMATVDGDDQLIFAVGAEHPDTVDPAHDPLTWRAVPWRQISETAPGPQPVTVDGRRRRLRKPIEDLVVGRDLERITYTRDEMPWRRLILERRVGDERWAVWIGDLVPATLIHVTGGRSGTDGP